MIDLSLEFRNGFGADLALLPKEYGLGYREDGIDLVSMHSFRLLIPFLAVYVNHITVEQEDVKESDYHE